MANDAVIFDFETLSQDPFNGVVVSMAILAFDTKRFFAPQIAYEYGELLHKSKVIKFDVADQVKRGRKIEKATLDWWSQQDKAAQEQLKPSPDDVSISELPSFFASFVSDDTKVVYSRNNTFDPMFLKSICDTVGAPLPYKWWLIRDTKSTIDGMTWGQNDIKDNFIPDNLDGIEFVKHDPKHDIVMDVMRLQYLSKILVPDDEVPW